MQHARTFLRTVVLGSLWCTTAAALAAGTLDKIKDSGKLAIGYTSDARPFAFADASGKPAGYAIELCAKVADALKSELKLSALSIDFVALPRDEALRAVEQGKADLLCGATPTLERRALVDFSIPILLSGAGAVIRADAPARLVQALTGAASSTPVWRASTDQAPQRAALAVVAGTTIEKALATSLKERRIVADIVTVKDTEAGMQALISGEAQAFFNDRALLLDAVARSKSPGDLIVLVRLFRRDLVALAMRRNDDDFRLLVDRTLSRLYRTPELAAIYTRHFGAPNPAARDFFELVTLPD